MFPLDASGNLLCARLSLSRRASDVRRDVPDIARAAAVKRPWSVHGGSPYHDDWTPRSVCVPLRQADEPVVVPGLPQAVDLDELSTVATGVCVLRRLRVVFMVCFLCFLCFCYFSFFQPLLSVR